VESRRARGFSKIFPGFSAVSDRLERCDRCCFWEAHDDSTGEVLGACHRHAPVCQPHDDSAGHQLALGLRWPATMEDEWCGDWQPLPVVQRREPPAADLPQGATAP